MATATATIRNPRLTPAEAAAIVRGLGETLDATTTEERRAIYGHEATARAAERGRRKLERALGADG
jgi:hypothetical protein